VDLSLKEYARINKLSIYQVVKKLQKGELKDYKKEIDGKMVQFIYSKDESISTSSTPKKIKQTEKSTKELQSPATKEDLEALREEIKSLKEEIKALRESLER